MSSECLVCLKPELAEMAACEVVDPHRHQGAVLGVVVVGGGGESKKVHRLLLDCAPLEGPTGS